MLHAALFVIRYIDSDDDVSAATYVVEVQNVSAEVKM